MSHNAAHIILDSLLEIFDPNKPQYAGVRDHFGPAKLARIDELRTKPATYEFTFNDKLFISWALQKAVMTATNFNDISEYEGA